MTAIDCPRPDGSAKRGLVFLVVKGLAMTKREWVDVLDNIVRRELAAQQHPLARLADDYGEIVVTQFSYKDNLLRVEGMINAEPFAINVQFG